MRPIHGRELLVDLTQDVLVAELCGMGVSDKVEVLLRAVEITERSRPELAQEIYAAKAKEWLLQAV